MTTHLHAAAVIANGVPLPKTTAAAATGALATSKIAAAADDDDARTGAVDSGISITFKDLCYFVQDPSKGKGAELQLLHNVTGSFRPGVLTALMVSILMPKKLRD